MTGLGFGSEDLWLEDDSNLKPTSRSNIGHDYELPEGVVEGSAEAKAYLAGEGLFKVVEIEVYAIRFK